MEDYHFHCFHASRETEPFPKAGLPGHASSDTLTLMSTPQDNRNATDERDHHFLDACFRCGQLLGRNRDIFMYKGDTPFCSEECRQQEIDADEARERRSKQQPAAATAKSSSTCTFVSRRTRTSPQLRPRRVCGGRIVRHGKLWCQK